MAADIAAIKSNFLLRAEIEAGSSLSAQRVWLVARFVAIDDGGSAEAVNISMEGSSSTWQFRGATQEQLLHALRLAIEEIDVLIAAEAADETPQPQPGALIPRVVSAPL